MNTHAHGGLTERSRSYHGVTHDRKGREGNRKGREGKSASPPPIHSVTYVPRAATSPSVRAERHGWMGRSR